MTATSASSVKDAMIVSDDPAGEAATVFDLNRRGDRSTAAPPY
jgi:hypothetical protein